MNPPPPPPQEEPTIADVHDNNDDDDDSDTSTSIEEENTENFCDNPTHEILADGILAIFKSTTDRLQERVQATRASQMELKAMLDSLSSKLHGIQMAQQTSPIFDEYVHKLISVKHKVTVIYNVLYTTQVSKRLAFLVGRKVPLCLSRTPFAFVCTTKNRNV